MHGALCGAQRRRRVFGFRREEVCIGHKTKRGTLSAVQEIRAFWLRTAAKKHTGDHSTNLSPFRLFFRRRLGVRGLVCGTCSGDFTIEVCVQGPNGLDWTPKGSYADDGVLDAGSTRSEDVEKYLKPAEDRVCH